MTKDTKDTVLVVAAFSLFCALGAAAVIMHFQREQKLIEWSIECAKNPVATWKNDRCVRIEEAP